MSAIALCADPRARGQMGRVAATETGLFDIGRSSNRGSFDDECGLQLSASREPFRRRRGYVACGLSRERGEEGSLRIESGWLSGEDSCRPRIGARGAWRVRFRKRRRASVRLSRNGGRVSRRRVAVVRSGARAGESGEPRGRATGIGFVPAGIVGGSGRTQHENGEERDAVTLGLLGVELPMCCRIFASLSHSSASAQ
jgi:hypothetical protein